ncbi:hypothetical protein HDU97_007344 [Phlyctochytrium planicorne]|nr:hypothetical protein HDU97_007344 [Phlyctochytrium planicorne]
MSSSNRDDVPPSPTTTVKTAVNINLNSSNPTPNPTPTPTPAPTNMASHAIQRLSSTASSSSTSSAASSSSSSSTPSPSPSTQEAYPSTTAATPAALPLSSSLPSNNSTLSSIPLAAAFLPPIHNANTFAAEQLHEQPDHTTINLKDMPSMDLPTPKQMKDMNGNVFEVVSGNTDDMIKDAAKLDGEILPTTIEPTSNNNNGNANDSAGAGPASGSSTDAAAKPPARTQKLIYFEGLRGIAALQVVFIHTLHYFKELDNWSRLYQRWSSAVPIFFILSGGIITRSILQANASGRSTPAKLLQKLYSSFIRRPFRFLLPLYFGSLYKMMLIKYFELKADNEHALPESVFQFFAEPLRFLIYSDGHFPAFIPIPSWTLYPEMLGSMVIYIVTAVLLPYADNPRIRYITLATMFLFFFFSDNWSFYFLIGYTISDMTVSGYTAKFMKWRFSTLVKILMLVVSCGITYEFSRFPTDDAKEVYNPNPVRKQLLEWFGVAKFHTNPGWNFPEHSLLVFYCTTIFFLIETTPILQWILSLPPIAYLGRISFMLYLLHQDTAIMLSPRTEHLTHEGVEGHWKKFLFETAICILVADVATRVFDEPLQKVVRRAEQLILHDKWYWLPVRRWPGFVVERCGEFPGFVHSRVKASVVELVGKVKGFGQKVHKLVSRKQQ